MVKSWTFAHYSRLQRSSCSSSTTEVYPSQTDQLTEIWTATGTWDKAGTTVQSSQGSGLGTRMYSQVILKERLECWWCKHSGDKLLMCKETAQMQRVSTAPPWATAGVDWDKERGKSCEAGAFCPYTVNSAVITLLLRHTGTFTGSLMVFISADHHNGP